MGRRSVKAADNDWRLQGACLTADPDLFFPVGSGRPDRARSEQARQVCRGCSARTECLDWAIDVGATDGIWGGLDELERRALQRERRSTTAAATRAE